MHIVLNRATPHKRKLLLFVRRVTVTILGFNFWQLIKNRKVKKSDEKKPKGTATSEFINRKGYYLSNNQTSYAHNQYFFTS